MTELGTKWVGPGDDDAGIRLVTNAASGSASAIDPDSGDVTAGIVLAVTGRTLDSPDNVETREYIFNHDQAMAVCGMMFEELPDEHRAPLLAHWRATGLLDG